MNQYENKCRPPVFGPVSGILLDKIKKDAIIAKISGGSKQKEALEDIPHYTSGASMLTEFDEDLFTRFVNRVIVYSRTEIGFDMKCGPIFQERI